MSTVTPMMAQYGALKSQAGDCLLFYRMGDFFELFFDDARIAAGVLDIALTTRGEHDGEPVPMCGVPVHAAESYLARLIRAGHRVAIAEQVETPAQAKARGGSKALVARDIVRFVTAGTLTEEALLQPARANRLVALAPLRGRVGIAACDVSTGALELAEVAPDALASALARLEPTEIIGPDSWAQALPGTAATPRPADAFDSETGTARLAELGLAPAQGIGAGRPALAAAAGLLDYLHHVGRGRLPLLLPPVLHGAAVHLELDAATRASLEITAAQGGGRAGSLLDAVDRCRTAAGSRLLAEDLSAPLASREAIMRRLAGVAFLHGQAGLRDRVRAALRPLPDLARALGRLVAGRGTPRDLGLVRDALAGAEALSAELGTTGAGTTASALPLPPLLSEIAGDLGGHAALEARLRAALVPAPATERAGGGYIVEGYDGELDTLRGAAAAGRQAIAALEGQYREALGLPQLKIRHNAVLGYFVEVSARNAERLLAADSGFAHRQTTAGAMRFNSVGLHEEATRIASAGADALAREEAHFAALVAAVLEAQHALAACAGALARLDVCAALAERAAEGDWCLPELVDTPCLEVEDGRHPVVEAALAGGGTARFVANNCSLGPADRVWLVGGPNMGGKSTFLRQNALIVLLAQAGSFVPARRATIGIADRLFSRVGASDNLARGQSTFMVEMVETAAILRGATERSVVILDEIGRGTSTYDGLALAWAVAEAVHDAVRCRCLFATHYHELARLAERCEALSLHHVRAREWKGELVLLHEVAPGAADRSYGLAVARLAGVPEPVIARAREVLDRLEEGRARTGGLAAGLADLPLFAAAQTTAPPAPGEAILKELATLDLDALSPREALDRLYALRAEARAAGGG